MPITENVFTEQELLEAIEKNPEIMNSVVPQALEKKNYKLFTQEGLANHETEVFGRKATEYANELKTIAGIEFKGGDFDSFFKSTIKELSETKKTLSDEITRLKGTSNLTEEEKKRLADYEKLAVEKDNEIEALKNNHKSEIETIKIQSSIERVASSLSSKMVKNPLVEEAIQIVSEKTIAEMTKAAKIVNGKLAFIGEDGNLLKNKNNSYLTAEEVYLQKMDKYVDKGKITTGAGGNGGKENPVQGEFKTRYELTNYLYSKGLIGGSKEYTEEYKKHNGDSLPLR